MANHRSPNPLIRKTADPTVHPVLFFWDKIEPEPNSGCWLWVGSVNGKYPKLWDGRVGHVIFAHRFSWTVFRGPIPPKHEIDHRCRVTLCVNPRHLEPVTSQINMQRAAAARRTRGAAHGPRQP
jgi:hypothetical protein